jgi:site-specific DNA-methyltransferase (cytosine-N4-specific)
MTTSQKSIMHDTSPEVDPAGDPRTEIAQIIRSHYKPTFDDTLEVGRCLIGGAYTRKDYDTYNLPFTYGHGRKMIKIANDLRITNPANRAYLPDVMGALYEITLLSDKLFQRAVAEGVINPRCNWHDVNVFRRRHSVSVPIQALRIKPATATYADAEGKYQIHAGDALTVLRTLPSDSVHTCITSPPYYQMRDYLVDGQLGHEETPELYVEKLVEIFGEVRRVLRPDGTLWVNIGDCYAGSGKGNEGDGTHCLHKKTTTNRQGNPDFDRPCREQTIVPVKHLPPGYKDKDLIEVSSMLSDAMRKDGWWVRSRIIWEKPSIKPESVKDRPTVSHEYVFQLAKSPEYFYDYDAIREPAVTGDVGATRNKRTVWRISPKRYKEAHFAQFPPEIPETCLLATSPPKGIVMDCFAGAGTTGAVAIKHGRSFIGIDLNPAYAQMIERRLSSKSEAA